MPTSDPARHFRTLGEPCNPVDKNMIISDNKQTSDNVIIQETSQLLPLISWPQQEHIAKRRRSVIRLRDRAAD